MSKIVPKSMGSGHLKRSVSQRKIRKKKCDEMCAIDVMLIDDSQFNLIYLQEFLLKENIRSVKFDNGADAI